MSVAAPATTGQLAAVIRSPRSFTLAPAAVPRIGPREVLLKLDGCGVCGSDVPVWEGRPWFQYPLDPGTPGHEGWGVVADVGDAVTTVAVGQRVAAITQRGYARFDVCDQDALVSLPDGVAGAFPGEAVACAMNVFARSGIRNGQTVAVIGIGFIGALLVQLAASVGARVIAVSRRGFSLEIARLCGSTEELSSDRNGAEATVADITDGGMCDAVVEAAGRQSTLDVAAALVKERGRLVIAGYHQDGARSVDMQSWNWRGIDVINAHERRREVYVDGLRRAVDAVAASRIDLAPLITHEFDLRDLDRALQAASERPDGFLKGVVRC